MSSLGSTRTEIRQLMSLADWVLFMEDTLYWYWSVEDLLELLVALHKAYGHNPPEAAALYQGIRKIGSLLEGFGLVYRFEDALAKASGAMPETPIAPSLREVSFYLDSAHTLHSGAIQLVTDAESDGQIFIKVDTAIIPAGLVGTIVKAINANLPPALQLDLLSPGSGDGQFAAVINVFDVQLDPRNWSPPLVLPWTALLPAVPKAIQDSNGDAVIAPQVIQKSSDASESTASTEDDDAEEECYVLNYVLRPGVVDNQNHVVSKSEVRAACHWWAEHVGNSGFSVDHVLMGGERVAEGDIVMLENYLLPKEMVFKTDGEDITLEEGTWMLAARINKDSLWASIKSGEYNAWSIGAVAALEPLEMGQAE